MRKITCKSKTITGKIRSYTLNTYSNKFTQAYLPSFVSFHSEQRNRFYHAIRPIPTPKNGFRCFCCASRMFFSMLNCNSDTVLQRCWRSRSGRRIRGIAVFKMVRIIFLEKTLFYITALARFLFTWYFAALNHVYRIAICDNFLYLCLFSDAHTLAHIL